MCNKLIYFLPQRILCNLNSCSYFMKELNLLNLKHGKLLWVQMPSLSSWWWSILETDHWGRGNSFPLFRSCSIIIFRNKMRLSMKFYHFFICRQVALNGKTLEMIDDHTLPQLVPIQQSASQGIKLSALTFGFFVFPHANATACQWIKITATTNWFVWILKLNSCFLWQVFQFKICNWKRNWSVGGNITCSLKTRANTVKVRYQRWKPE